MSKETALNDRKPARLLGVLSVICSAGLSGCATPPPLVLHDPVGPLQPYATRDDESGQLVVYSATRVTTTDDSEYPVHTPYTLYGPDEKLLLTVDNQAGLFSQAPSRISLAPGPYRVQALAADAGFVIVPVVIVPHKTTIVDLDGTALFQRQAAPSRDDARWVRLPNGRVIGAQIP